MYRYSDEQQIHRILNQRSVILKELRARNFRITKPREIILDIIIEQECTSCKEIYYKANMIDPTIGIATVYRMVNILETIGAIDRKNLYRINDPDSSKHQEGCTITFANNETVSISNEELIEILENYYRKSRPENKHRIESVVMKKDEKVIRLK